MKNPVERLGFFWLKEWIVKPIWRNYITYTTKSVKPI